MAKRTFLPTDLVKTKFPIKKYLYWSLRALGIIIAAFQVWRYLNMFILYPHLEIAIVLVWFGCHLIPFSQIRQSQVKASLFYVYLLLSFGVIYIYMPTVAGAYASMSRATVFLTILLNGILFLQIWLAYRQISSKDSKAMST